MKKYLLFLVLFLPLLWNWQWTFDDLFNDIIFDEYVDENISNSDDISWLHWVSDFNLPKPIYTTYTKDWKTYLKIDWSIDKSLYFPIILITKDWQSYYSEQLWSDVLLEHAWHYNVRAQARVNWEYVYVDETVILNDNINYWDIWRPAAWPSIYVLLILAFILFFSYKLYKLRISK